MSRARLAGAVLAGLVLAGMPWWRYAAPGFSAQPHTNHAPRYGGQLAMSGDHHVELVRRHQAIEVHVSDARRRPLRPVSASVVVDGTARVPLRWQRQRFVGVWEGPAGEIEAVATLPGGHQIAVVFDVGDQSRDDDGEAR